MPRATRDEQLAELKAVNKVLQEQLDRNNKYTQSINDARTKLMQAYNDLNKEVQKLRLDLTRVALAYDTVREAMNRTSVSLVYEGINPSITTTTTFNPYPTTSLMPNYDNNKTMEPKP